MVASSTEEVDEAVDSSSLLSERLELSEVEDVSDSVALGLS